MADKNTGFHPADADWTTGRALALAEAEASGRRELALLRKVSLGGGPK